MRDGALLLSRFARSHRWTLPGGGLDHGERPEESGSTDRAEWVPLVQLDSLSCSSLIGIGIDLGIDLAAAAA